MLQCVSKFGTIRLSNKERINVMSIEEYKVLVLSTEHLTQDDFDILDGMIFTNMVMSRDTGYFVKLYSEQCYNTDAYEALSPSFAKIVQYASDNKFGMIEFDSDAPAQPGLFKTFS